MPYAIEYDRLGGPEVLEYREIAHKLPGRGEVLVEARAIGVNPIDWKLRSGVRPSRRSPVPVDSVRMPRA